MITVTMYPRNPKPFKRQKMPQAFIGNQGGDYFAASLREVRHLFKAKLIDATGGCVHNVPLWRTWSDGMEMTSMPFVVAALAKYRKARP